MAQNLSKLKATELEKFISGSILSRNKKIFDEYIVNELQNNKSDSNFSVPVAQEILRNSPSLAKKLINLYKQMFVLESRQLDGIDEEVMAMQGMLLDGLCFGLNVEKGGEMSLYTANPKAVFGVDPNSRFSIEKTIELNRQGTLHAMRVDVSYTSAEGFEYKLVNLNKNTCLNLVDLNTGEGRFYIIPYMFVVRAFALFDTLLTSGRTLKVVQEKDILKTRYISINKTELSKYVDMPEFVSDLNVEYFPLKGFFYAPILGAPVFSVGRTRIDILDICSINPSKNPKVEKVKDSFNSLLEDQISTKMLEEMEINDPESYEKLVGELPKKAMLDDPSSRDVIHYLREMKTKDREVFFSEIPGYSGYMDSVRSLFKDPKEVKISSKEDFNSVLKSNICRVTVRKKDCMYSSMVVTNNRNALKRLYGEDYFGKYESFGVRLYMLQNMLEGDANIEAAFAYCGFEYTLERDKAVTDIISGRGRQPDKNIHEQLADVLSDEERKETTRRSTSNEDVVLARSCFAPITVDGPRDLYRYVDYTRLVSCYIIG